MLANSETVSENLNISELKTAKISKVVILQNGSSILHVDVKFLHHCKNHPKFFKQAKS